MSVKYLPVSWTTSKKLYDAALIAGVALYLLAFSHLAAGAVDDQALRIKALGSCAFLLLSLVLAIGPLARLDRRFLPLLYNRRHFGVITCTIAASHALAVLGWYFAFSPLDPYEALLVADTGSGQLRGVPFVPFGMAALLILLVLAVTSHDFWLSFLTPPVWKRLHLGVYAAYGLVVLHTAFGALQEQGAFAIEVAICALGLVVLHLWAGLRERRQPRIAPLAAGGFVHACRLGDIAEGRAVVVRLTDADPVAIFRHDGRLSAVSNLCAHQNGPLGEGQVVDGCITCPWHGFQYRLADGCAPPPFTEMIATYRLRLDGDSVLLDPNPNPPGTHVEPLAVA
jgi:nitrite reductase/ring-hydroxylating ferredoxin subunit/DMSO/TMAO reductase YedYZ heme-binding membrane subunit